MHKFLGANGKVMVQNGGGGLIVDEIGHGCGSTGLIDEIVIVEVLGNEDQVAGIVAVVGIREGAIQNGVLGFVEEAEGFFGAGIDGF